MYQIGSIIDEFIYPVAPTDDSDKLTPQQVHDFEREHKLLFIYLALINNTYNNLFSKEYDKWKKSGGTGKFVDSTQGKILHELARTIIAKASAWFKVQNYLEQTANIPPVKVSISDFLRSGKQNLAILNQSNLWIDKSSGKVSGIGIIPLIIWGAIVIISAISAAYIVKRMTVTTADREELLQKAQDTCKLLKLTPDECSNVVTTTQREESRNAQAVTDTAASVTSGFKSLLLLPLIIGGGLLLFGGSHKHSEA